MLCSRLIDPAVLSQGIFTGSRLNPGIGNISQYGTPAIVADINPSSGTEQDGATVIAGGTTGNTGGGGAHFSTVSSDNFMLPWITGQASQTSTPGDFVTITTSAYAVDVIPNYSVYGGIIHVQLDNQPATTMSSYAPITATRYYLDGKSHTLTFTLKGDVQRQSNIIGTPYDVSGTAGLAASLSLANDGAPFTLPGTYAFQGQSGQIQIINPHGATSTLVDGQVTTTAIPGVLLGVSAGAWNTTSYAEVQIQSPVMGLDAFIFYSQLATTATYQTPTVNTGDVLTEWPYLEMVEGPIGATVPSISVYIGTDGVNFSGYALAPTTTIDPNGNNWQRIVYSMPPGAKGSYMYAIGTISNQPFTWASDLRIWSWTPETDPYLQSLPSQVYESPNMKSLVTSLAALTAYVDELTDELTLSTSISTSIGYYLYLYGTQYDLVQLGGESFSSYRSRITGLTKGRNVGDSQPFLQTTLSGALLGAPTGISVSPLARAGSLFSLGSATLGITPLGLNATGYWRYQVLVPLSQLKIPLENALNVIYYYRPVGSIVSVVCT